MHTTDNDPAATATLSEVLKAEHREMDADLESFVTSIASPGGDDAQLRRAMAALRRHIYAEEELLFPALQSAGHSGPIIVMLREHAQMWKVLDALEGLLATTPGSDGCLAACEDLFDQLQRHNPKEELILYPQAAAVLTADQLAELHAFLASGEPPKGWTCRAMEG